MQKKEGSSCVGNVFQLLQNSFAHTCLATVLGFHDLPSETYSSAFSTPISQAATAVAVAVPHMMSPTGSSGPPNAKSHAIANPASTGAQSPPLADATGNLITVWHTEPMTPLPLHLDDWVVPILFLFKGVYKKVIEYVSTILFFRSVKSGALKKNIVLM